MSGGTRVRIVAPGAEAKRLAGRLTRGGIAAAPDDGSGAAEILVTVGVAPEELAPYRTRAQVLCAVGTPLAPYYAFGADEAVPPQEPEALFRRLRSVIERNDLLARIDRLEQKASVLEHGIADAAHDLRAPLHACIGNADLLAKDSRLAGDLKEDAQRVVRQAERAIQLAERILAAARNNTPAELEAARVDLGSLVETAVRNAEATARARSVTLVAAPPDQAVEIRADDELLQRLLDNLIANAVKFTPAGGVVEVSGWRASPRNVRLSVRDSGPGIASADLGKLVAGLGPGRGLRICREIAEKHGGDFWAESTPGQGSRFLVELPLAFPQSRPNVLVVSDDQTWVEGVARSLRQACDVRSSSLAEAKLAGHTDLILVESKNARRRGLAALRTAARGAKVPVIELPSELATARLARTLALLTA